MIGESMRSLFFPVPGQETEASGKLKIMHNLETKPSKITISNPISGKALNEDSVQEMVTVSLDWHNEGSKGTC